MISPLDGMFRQWAIIQEPWKVITELTLERQVVITNLAPILSFLSNAHHKMLRF